MTTHVDFRNKVPVAGVRVLEIKWHWKERGVGLGQDIEGVEHLAFRPGDEKRLATAGNDGSVRQWDFDASKVSEFLLSPKEEAGTLMMGLCRYVVSLYLRPREAKEETFTGISQPIPTCLHWSPNGTLLLAGYTSGDLVLWHQVDTSFTNSGMRLNLSTAPQYVDVDAEESWKPFRRLRIGDTSPNAVEIITAGAISPTSRHVAATCIDGSLSLYHLNGSGSYHEKAHHGPAQGIAWDPLDNGNHLVTAGADARLKFWKLSGTRGNDRNTVVGRGGELGLDRSARPRRSACSLLSDQQRDPVRHLSWSPDGALLGVALGLDRLSITEETQNFKQCAYIFHRSNFYKPYLSLAMADALRISGIVFAPRLLQALPLDIAEGSGIEHQRLKGAWGPPSHRYALALWSPNEVAVYTSDQSARIASFSRLHGDRITHVAWHPTCSFLLVASLDGFVSLCGFLQPFGKTLPQLTAFSNIQLADIETMTLHLYKQGQVLTDQQQIAKEIEEQAINSERLGRIGVSSTPTRPQVQRKRRRSPPIQENA